jgi:hypothetical protein
MLEPRRLDSGVVLVWQGCVLQKNEECEFIDLMKKIGALKVHILGQLKTKPDVGDPESGGRNDLFFEVEENSSGFWVQRLKFGIRLLADVISKTNGYYRNPIYPQFVLDYVRDDERFN